MKKTLLSLLCIVAGVFAASAKEVTDVLLPSEVGVSGTSYTAYTNQTATNGSAAVYYFQCAGGNSAFQFRSSNSTSGVVSTTSGGKLVSVTVTWNTNTASARTVDVYGKATAYSTPSDLYKSNDAGTKIGTMAFSDKNADNETTLTAGDDYEYIGIRSVSGALYIDKITIVWDVAGDDDTPQVARPVITPAGGKITADTEISISCATDDAAIYYTYTPDDAAADFVAEQTLYTEPFKISESGKIAAVAKKTGYDDSNETSVSFTVLKYIHVQNIAEMVNLNNTLDYMVLDNEVAVTVQSGNSIYVKDATGALCIYDSGKTLSLSNGQRLTGITGKFVKYNTGSQGDAYLPELTEIVVSTFNPVDGDPVYPEEVAIEDCAADQGAAYVKIVNATIAKDETATGSYAANYFIVSDETGSLTLYNSNADIEVKAGVATVEGVLSCYQGNLQIIPTKVEYTEIADPVKGDKELPYTVAEIKELYAADNTISKPNTWITGYIVGCVKTSTSPYTYEFAPAFDANTNILIAEEFDENSFSNCIAVQLPSGANRTALNLVDNAGKHRALVKLCGTVTKYLSTSGLTNVSGYEIVETYTETQVCRPAITPAAGEITNTTEITITCPTADASIYYTFTPAEAAADFVAEKKLYEAPFTLKESGSVAAYAVKEGLADSKTVTVAYTVPEVNNVANIAALIALDDTESYYAITGEVAVTYQNGKNIFVKDDTGYLCVFDSSNSLSLSNGDRLTGITGKFAKYNSGDNGDAYLPELTSIDVTTFTATAGEAVAPEVLTVAEITAAKAAAYVQVKDAAVAVDETATGNNAAKYFVMTDETGSMTLYNGYGKSVAAAAKADVTGIVNVYSGALQLNATADVVETSGIADVDSDADVTVYGLVGAISVVGYEGTVEVYNTLGQLVAAAPVAGNALIPAHAGLAIVKAGNVVAKVIVK